MRTYTEINLDALTNNIRKIKSVTKSKVMAIIKADAYGHGIERIAHTLSMEGVDAFGVSNADEAMEVRNFGFSEPILILGIIFPEDYPRIIQNDITCAIDTFESAKKLSDTAMQLGKQAKIHIKLDTGMGRIGFVCGDDDEAVANEIQKISQLPGIKITGIFSHLSRADEEDSSYADMQFNLFTSMCSRLTKMGIDTGIRHIANSGATALYPHMHLDMVRAGMILYGMAPSEYVFNALPGLMQVMSFKTKICHIKEMQREYPISYGGTYKTYKGQKIATIPIGYADGFLRSLSGKASVLVNGKYAKVVGRICMDQCMIDVTHIENIKIGDEVIIFGTDGNNTITVESVAKLIDTINYEIVCSVTRRVPRAYIQGNKITETLNYLE